MHGIETKQQDGKPYLSLHSDPNRIKKPRKVKAIAPEEEDMSAFTTSSSSGEHADPFGQQEASFVGNGPIASTSTSTSAFISEAISAFGFNSATSADHTAAPTPTSATSNNDTTHLFSAMDGAHHHHQQQQASHIATHLSAYADYIPSINHLYDGEVNEASRRTSIASHHSVFTPLGNDGPHSEPSATSHHHQQQQPTYGIGIEGPGTQNGPAGSGYGLLYGAKQRLGSLHIPPSQFSAGFAAHLQEQQYQHQHQRQPVNVSTHHYHQSSHYSPTYYQTGQQYQAGSMMHPQRRSADHTASTSTSMLTATGNIGPLTPGTPASITSCFSAPEIRGRPNAGDQAAGSENLGGADDSKGVRARDIGASPFLESVDAGNSSTANGQNGDPEESMKAEKGDGANEKSNAASSQSRGMPEHLQPIHTPGAGMEGDQYYAGPHSAGFPPPSHWQAYAHQFHASVPSTAPPTQTVFIDHRHHHNYSPHVQVHPSASGSGGGQYDHLPTPASSASFFSNTSSAASTNAEKQTTAPSSANAVSPYSHEFPGDAQCAGSSGAGAGVSGSNADAGHGGYMHIHPPSGPYGYGGSYAVHAAPASAGPAPPGYYADHPQQQQQHYQQQGAGPPSTPVEWASPTSQKDGSRVIVHYPPPSASSTSGHYYNPYVHPPLPAQQQQRYSAHHHHHQPHHHHALHGPVPHHSRSNSFHVRDVLGQARKPSLPSGRDGSPFEPLFKVETGTPASPQLVVGDEPM